MRQVVFGAKRATKRPSITSIQVLLGGVYISDSHMRNMSRGNRRLSSNLSELK